MFHNSRKIEITALPQDAIPTSLQDIELLAEEGIRKEIRQWIEESETGSVATTTRCRECGEIAKFSSWQAGIVRTRFGLVRYTRAQYSCPSCYHFTYPLDERINPLASLARLRTKLAAGKSLPVADLAKSWGLGSFNQLSVRTQRITELACAGNNQPNSELGAAAIHWKTARTIPLSCHHNHSELTF
jgi:hypothetical protein